MIKVNGKEVYATYNLKRLNQASFTVWKDDYFPDSHDDIFVTKYKEKIVTLEGV